MAAGLLIPLLFWGCEESITDTTIVLPYERELVIQGFLTAGSGNDSIFVTQTIPPLEKWTLDRAAITDARVVAIHNGVELPFRHVRTGFYVPDGWVPEEGGEYRLEVESRGLIARGVAHVPTPSTGPWTYLVDTVRAGCYDPEEDYRNDFPSDPIDEEQLRLEIDDGSDVEYTISMDIVRTFVGRNGEVSMVRYREDVWRSERVGDIYRAILRSQCIDPISTVPNSVRDFDTLYIRVIEHEPGYTDYYRSRWSDGGDDFFGPSGEEPEWNVTGNGFGWFFGRTIIRDTVTSVP